MPKTRTLLKLMPICLFAVILYYLSLNYLFFETVKEPIEIPREHKHQTVLIMGRGPSAYDKVNIEPNRFDRVLKLKLCKCDCKTCFPNRCDIVAYHSGEFFGHERIISKDYETCKSKEIWIFDALRTNRKIKKISDVAQFRKISSDTIDYWAKRYGFNIKEHPRFTTGMASILEAIRVFKNPVYIKGFDALIKNDITSGHHDDTGKPTTPNTNVHSIPREHKLLMDLVNQGKVEIIS
jgi:hypothetical protein